jgi:hypothetical protein
MIPWESLDQVKVPSSWDELAFYKRSEEFSIRTGEFELMNSRVHVSEDALSKLTLEKITVPSPKILIGGLSME